MLRLLISLMLLPAWAFSDNPVPATGQTHCYDPVTHLEAPCHSSGQDGEYLGGHEHIYTVNGSATVTDEVLNLTWQIDYSELKQHGVILQASNTHTRNIVEKALQLGAHKRIVMESNYLETIKAMIQNNLGWGGLPESMIDKSLVKLSVNKSKMKRELGVIYHAARTLSNPAIALSDLLKQHISS